MREQGVWVLLVLLAAAAAAAEPEEGGRERHPPGMKIFGRKPRVDMRVMNSMNKLSPPSAVPWVSACV